MLPSGDRSELSLGYFWHFRAFRGHETARTRAGHASNWGVCRRTRNPGTGPRHGKTESGANWNPTIQSRISDLHRDWFAHPFPGLSLPAHNTSLSCLVPRAPFFGPWLILGTVGADLRREGPAAGGWGSRGKKKKKNPGAFQRQCLSEIQLGNRE